MRKLLLSLLAAASLVGAFGLANSGSADEQVRPGDVATDDFGLRIGLDTKKWRAIEKTPGKLVLQYALPGEKCGRQECSRFTVAVSADGFDGSYYTLNVGQDFRTLVMCNQMTWAVSEAARQADFMVGGKALEHFINDPCPSAPFVPKDTSGRSQPRSFVWFLPGELVMRFDEEVGGARLGETGLEQVLQNATTWLS